MAKAARAKAPTPSNPKAKALKITAESAKYCGYEPEWAGVKITEANRTEQLILGLNWYNYNFGAKDAKQFIIDYLTINKHAEEAKLFKKVSDNAVSNSLGWIARMTMMGWELNKAELHRLSTDVEKAIDAVAHVAEVDPAVAAKAAKTKKFNIQERMREKAAEAGGEIEGMLDDYIAAGAKAKHNFTPIAALKLANILPAHVPGEILHWEGIVSELKGGHAAEDADLKEGYGHFTKIQLRNLIKFVELIISDYNSYVAYKKASKAPRKRKVKTPAQLAVKLKFMVKNPELNIQSVVPAKIVGAKEMFAYDVKKRKLMYFVADEYAGTLTIKNNTIVGFDVMKSQQKTVRKPKDQLKTFMAASKPASRKYYKDVKSVETKMSGRFNENIVILKVW